MLIIGRQKAPFTYGRLGLAWDRLARARGRLARSEDYDRQINANLKRTLEALVEVAWVGDVSSVCLALSWRRVKVYKYAN
jgi:hypothetical protein